jgi:UDP-3-O-[3-hydroxymyristoyl] glucosamine N-acyltransferase
MDFPRSYKLSEVAEILKCKHVGDASMMVKGMNEIHVVRPGDIVFVDHPKYYDKALQSAATFILINKQVACPEGKGLLISDDPFRDFNLLTNYFKPFELSKTLIHASAQIGENTQIAPNVSIGANVRIGQNTIIHPNVTIYPDTQIGDHVVIHAGTVIGADAFYYKNRPTGYDQLKSGGGVLIENAVHIGALCAIDRGVSGITTIREGSKLDNHIQVGHDTVLGVNCLVAAHTAIAGCVVVGANVKIWGQVAVSSGLTIGDHAEVLGKSGVSRSIAGNQKYWGTPAVPFNDYVRDLVSVKNLIKKDRSR